MSEIHCRYIISYNTPEQQTYDLYFNPIDMSLLDKSFANQAETPMPWAELESNKCSHCPLSKEKHSYCPAAAAIGKVAHKFADVKSYTATNVAVITPDRTYLKKTSTQEALHSLFGLIMATSGCPHLQFLRPMARFHLPFANANETMVRTLSFYLLKNFLAHQNKLEANVDLAPLNEAYEKVQIVNQHLAERIRSLGKGDADLNAVVILDTFVSLLTMQMGQDFADLRPLFVDQA